MRGTRQGRMFVRLFALVMLLSCFTVVFGSQAAKADPECVNGGAYVLFARGSGEKFDGPRAQSFQHHIMQSLANAGVSSKWAELGNLDNHTAPDGQPDKPAEYPAVAIAGGWDYLNIVDGDYNDSVTKGKNELVTHLNDRYSGDGPRGTGACANETLVLGGYSQGADVVGWALRSSELSQAAKNHIGYAALYGDPKFNPGSLSDRLHKANFQSNWWWVRGDDAGYRYRGVSRVPNSGRLGARNPYVPSEFKGRFGSWCADHDGVCSGIAPWGINVHESKYQDYWIQNSADEIVYAAKQKRDHLSVGNNSAVVSSYLTTVPFMAPPGYYAENMTPIDPPPPVIKSVKRTKDPDGTPQVYAATKSAVTEAWWHPGGDGVHTDEIIHISQDNIVGFDKVNEPDGVTQSLYTAVPDGIWETWWRPGEGVHHAKIVSGLSGVRQVIADNRWENGQYVHRLYALASDGPYEVWWKDGGDGVHVSRLNNISGPVTMTNGTGPDGAYELFVATPTWVYELWWFPGGTVNYRAIINITQGDIRSLNMGANLNDGQLLYTGTSTTAWQSGWLGDNGAISTSTIATGQADARQVKKTVTDGAHQLYLATPDHVQE